VVPYIPDLEAAPPLAQALSAGAQPRMVVGHRASVMALHNAFRPPRPARELRDPQPLMVLDRGDLRGTPSSDVRLSTRGDLDALIVAAARMHREEMGVDPLAIDAPAWRMRMLSLIERRWSWIWLRDHEVMFKAELSAWTPDVVQVQGVYTAPQYRRQGIARAGLAAVCTDVFREVPRCSLYVNQYNVIAQRVYERLGFKPADVFATVMY
jgi:ribosomal protein S18 acetylase RimI-like enzyme